MIRFIQVENYTEMTFKSEPRPGTETHVFESDDELFWAIVPADLKGKALWDFVVANTGDGNNILKDIEEEAISEGDDMPWANW